MKIKHDLTKIRFVLCCPVCGDSVIHLDPWPSIECVSKAYAEALISAGVERVERPCSLECSGIPVENVKKFDPEEANMMKLGIGTNSRERIDLAINMCDKRKE
jgi:hypothetical protein